SGMVIRLLGFDQGFSPSKFRRDLGDEAALTSHAAWWFRFRLPGPGMSFRLSDWDLAISTQMGVSFANLEGTVAGPRGSYDGSVRWQYLDVGAEIELCTPRSGEPHAGCFYAEPQIGFKPVSPGGTLGLRLKL